MNLTPRLPLSVLVVEDQDDCAQSTAELLTMCGHAVRVATCGPDALRDAAVEIPDVVLLDIQLPGPTGWEVASRLRERAGGRQPLLVAVTGCGSEEDRWRSADAGIDLHLVKPVAPADLIRLLDWVGGHLAARAVPTTACG
ncbi:response regulator [Gemmata sp. JC717]|uniref:Response regulator n=1 Tax=Gemmata algarum TaxID=2975278 RepID=A0ABU5EUF2_9BACT|nr:response regulator [Gemmata algarum]MDY3552211.1 response regulator [Gemmata algarum]MDY3558751.1 response regulator [Gemmata algarum]